MTIDSTKPLATDLISSLDNYIREDREQINDLWRAIVAANATETNHNMGSGEFYLEIGNDLEDVILELVNLTADVAVNLIQITNGSGGMLKVIKAGDGNVTVVHNASYICLLSGISVTLAAGDMLVLMNVGGDPDSSINGVWYEILNTANTGGGGGSNTTASATLGTGDTELVGGTDVSAGAVTEIVKLSAAMAETLETISGCLGGAVKYIIANGSNISIKKTTHMMICQPASNDTFDMSDGDTIGLVNYGGNPGVSNGVWYEIGRSFAV